MPEAINYCDKCGRLIPPGEIEDGKGAAGSPALCDACAQAPDRETGGGSPRSARPGAPRVARRSAPFRREAPRSRMPLVAGVVVCALAGAGAALLLVGRSAPRERRPAPLEPAAQSGRSTSPSARATDARRPPVRAGKASGSPAEPAPAPSSAASAEVRRRLKELRDLVDPRLDPQLGRRDEFLKDAEKLLADLAGRPEAAEVKELVNQVEARYVGLAEKALADALQAVEVALARGRFDDAARSFGYVRIRFGESEWFRTTGEARIAAATRKIDEARAAYAASGLTLSDDFSGYQDGSNGSPKWASQGAGVKGGALELERGGWAHFDVRKDRFLTAEAIVVPKKRTRGEWTACGLVAWKHGGEYWETGLGHGPKGGRYLWFYELYGGVWHVLHKPCAWEYGRTYKVRMELTADGLTGYVEEPGGKKLGRIGKKFDEKRRASARCRPGVFASGCGAVFDDVSAVVRGGAAPSVAAAPPGAARAEPDLPAAKPAAARSKETPVEPGKKPASAEKAEKKPARAVKLPGGPAEPLPGETGLPGQWAPGLIAEIFKGHDFTERVGVRIDRQIDFNFGPAAADLGAPADNFAVRWTGWLLVPREGEYVFEADADDHLSVKLDGKKLVSGKWGDAKGRSPPVHCAAGLHPISATYLEWGGGALVHLRWHPPGGGMQAIPAGYFFHEVPEPGKMGPFARLLEGMWGEYYKGENFDRKVGEGSVEHPAVDYGELPPLPACPRDNFSVRMKGHILLYWSGTYRFDVDVDDGVRLKIDGERIINHWGKPSVARVSGKKELAAGYHEVVVEHMERGGDAKIHFWWVPPAYGDIDKPTTYFMPRKIWFYSAARRDVVDRKGLAPGMKGRFYGRPVPGGKVLLRSLDPAASFAWGGSPGSGVPHDGFSCKWEGRLVVPASGLYSFRVRHRGGVQLAIAGRPVIRKWEDADGWQEGSIALRAGALPVSLKYSNPRGKAEVRVYWSGPGFALRTLGADALAHKAAALVVARPWEEGQRKVALADRTVGDAAGKTRSAGKAARTVTGNQVPNGGFEEMDAETRFASRWRRGQWGKKGAQYSVRIDRSNPHAGDRALAVRNLAPGALPGAETTLALPPGEYELRYWACADVGATAEVHASSAGRELRTNAVGEDWRQLKQKIEIGEDLPRVGLRLWISTPGVRVWFDDVEVVPMP